MSSEYLGPAYGWDGDRRRSIRTGVRWMKFIFTPLSILFGLIAGALAERVFELLWRLLIHEQPPRPAREEVVFCAETDRRPGARGSNLSVGQGVR